MPPKVRKFVCVFENGYQAFMGADSKEAALEAASQMEKMARSRMIDVREVPDAEIGTYLANALVPGIPDDVDDELETDVDDDIEI